MSFTILLEENNLYRAIGELAYFIARSDGVLRPIERLVFREAVKEDLGLNDWLAQDKFEALDNQGTPSTLEETYKRVIFSIRKNKNALTLNIIERFVKVLEKVAGVSGITQREIDLIEQFKGDALEIFFEHRKKNKLLNSQKGDKYRSE
jgi:hypothetical protein